MSKKVLAVFFLMIFWGVFSLCVSGSASAVDFSLTKSKATLEGVYQCFYVIKAYNANWEFGTENSQDGALKKAFVRDDGGDEAVKLPFGLTNASDNNLNCSEVLFNYGGGLLPEQIKNPWGNEVAANIPAVRDFFAGEDGKGGSGTLNYKASIDQQFSADANVGYKQLILNSIQWGIQIGEEKWVYPKSSGFELIDADGDAIEEKEYPDLVFPAVTRDNDGALMIVGSMGFNVPAPGSEKTYTYRVCIPDVNRCFDDIEVWDMQYECARDGCAMYYGSSFGKIKVDDSEDGSLTFWGYPNTSAHGDFSTAQRSITLLPLASGSELMPELHSKPAQYYGLADVVISEGKIDNPENDFSKVSFSFINTTEYGDIVPIKTLSDKNGNMIPGLGDYGYNKLALTDQEVYDLYKYYVREVYKVPVACEGDPSFDYIKNLGGSVMINWAFNKECWASVGDSGVIRNPGNVYGVAAPKKLESSDVYVLTDKHFKYKVDLDIVIDTLRALPIATLENNDETGTFDYTIPEDQHSGSVTKSNACYTGSGPIGWLICPIVKMIAGIGEWAWDYIEQSFMIIPTEFFTDGGGIWQAWDVIRNIANVLFIVLFLVVIFSQLTGVGIDNYGIKKILPRLIMVAILVNLSWIICELMADVSNIVGSGISGMLTGFAEGIATPVADTGMTIVGGFGDIVFGAGAGFLFALLSGGGSLIVGAAALGLAVLGVLISVLSGVVTMFIILIMRESAIILAIVLSPVAIVCYALPNTEKLAKRWYGIFKALLVVYPICGAALGAGRLASAVLASIGGDSVASVMSSINSGDLVNLSGKIVAVLSDGGRAGLMIAAMIAQILPFFFIPKLLKNSLSMIGNIGEKISRAGKGVGRRLSGTAQSGIKSSNRFKDFQQYRSNQAALKRAQRTRNRFTDKDGKKRTNLTKRQEDRLAKAQDFINAEKLRESRAKAGVYALSDEAAEQRAVSALKAQEFKASQEEFAGYNQDKLREVAEGADGWLGDSNGEQRMSALIGAMEANGMQADIYKMLEKNPSIGNKSSVMQSLANSRDKVLRAYGKKGAGMSYTDFMTKAVYKDASGKYTTDATKAAPGTGAVATSMMAQYVNEKGKDFLEGLDDKSLSQIRRFSTGDYAGNKIMNTGLLMDAASTMKSQDAINEVNNMIAERDDVSVTGSQLAKINKSTYDVLEKHAPDAVLSASDDIVKNNRQLINNMDSEVRKGVDKLRKDNHRDVMSAGGGSGSGSGSGSGTGSGSGASGGGSATTSPVEKRTVKVRPKAPVVPDGGGEKKVVRVRVRPSMESGDASATLAPDAGGGPAPAPRVDSDEHAQYSSMNEFIEDITADRAVRIAGNSPADIPVPIHGEYEEARSRSDFPSYIENAQDYKTYLDGAAAYRELPKIGDKSYSAAKAAGIPLLASVSGSETGYNDYVKRLQDAKDALDDLRTYHAIRGMSFGEASHDPNIQISGNMTESEFNSYKEQLKERVEKRRGGDGMSGSFDVPR
ncbi:hypothetical protein IKT18_03975 [Candidatus Saccharibacteria bacterium]|nr:hypothetical protein [Candidatus Saccharibacteria bacterium]